MTGQISTDSGRSNSPIFRPSVFPSSEHSNGQTTQPEEDAVTAERDTLSPPSLSNASAFSAAARQDDNLSVASPTASHSHSWEPNFFIAARARTSTSTNNPASHKRRGSLQTPVSRNHLALPIPSSPTFTFVGNAEPHNAAPLSSADNLTHSQHRRTETWGSGETLVNLGPRYGSLPSYPIRSDTTRAHAIQNRSFSRKTLLLLGISILLPGVAFYRLTDEAEMSVYLRLLLACCASLSSTVFISTTCHACWA